MTREETVRFIYDILKKHSVKVNEVDVIPVSSCIALVDDLIKHEADLLKEFVDYVIKQHTTEGGQKLVIFHQVLLDNLENFIKEKK